MNTVQIFKRVEQLVSDKKYGVNVKNVMEATIKALSEIGIDGAREVGEMDHALDEVTIFIHKAPVAAQILQLKQDNTELTRQRDFWDSEWNKAVEERTQLEAENAQLKRENEELKAPKLAFYMMRSQGFGKTSTAIRDMLLRLTEGSTIKITCPDVEKLEAENQRLRELLEEVKSRSESDVDEPLTKENHPALFEEIYRTIK